MLLCTILLRIYNPGEKGAETCTGKAPTPDHPPLLFPGTCRVSLSINSLHPTSSPTLLLHLLS
jgi:hypothetical protein